MNTTLSRILCIGALHVDHQIQCVGDTILGESNPAYTTKSCGGVAFNIAKLLTHLECVSGLASRLGTDQTGTDLINYLAKTQIELTDIGAEPGKHTAAYTALYSIIHHYTTLHSIHPTLYNIQAALFRLSEIFFSLR